MITYAGQERKQDSKAKLVTVRLAPEFKRFLEETCDERGCTYREFFTLLLQAEKFRLQSRQREVSAT